MFRIDMNMFKEMIFSLIKYYEKSIKFVYLIKLFFFYFIFIIVINRNWDFK